MSLTSMIAKAGVVSKNITKLVTLSPKTVCNGVALKPNLASLSFISPGLCGSTPIVCLLHFSIFAASMTSCFWSAWNNFYDLFCAGNGYSSVDNDIGRSCRPLLWSMLACWLTSSSTSACGGFSSNARQTSGFASARDGSAATGRTLGVRNGHLGWGFWRAAKTRMSARNFAFPTLDSLCSRSSYSGSTLVQPGTELGRGILLLAPQLSGINRIRYICLPLWKKQTVRSLETTF